MSNPADTQTVRALGYCRVSTKEQDASLLVQEKAIRDKCNQRAWDLIDVLVDNGQSGGTDVASRAQGELALALLKAGKADVLVVSRLDRLSRSLKDFTALMELAKAQGWSIVVNDLDLDTTTPLGEAAVNMLMTFAQLERKLIGQRVKETLVYKRDVQGKRLGRPRSLPDDVVNRIVRERLDGLSPNKIAAGLNADCVPTAQGGKAWYPATVMKIVNASTHWEL
jgi:DNA invertase Pin-like site-specific DNA recombinase